MPGHNDYSLRWQSPGTEQTHSVRLYRAIQVGSSTITVFIDGPNSLFCRVTSFSLSPRYLQVLLQGGLRPKESYNTSTLRSICSAGSPLKPELYEYIKDTIGHVYIQNVSGTRTLNNLMLSCKGGTRLVS